MSSPLTVYLIRHGFTPWNKQRLCMGQTDIPLDEEGHEQARSLCKVFEDREVDRILCSDLQRTRETAAPLSALKQKPVEIDPRLREICYGILEGSDPDSWPTRFPDLMAEWDFSSVELAPPGGESRGQLMSRCSEVLEELVEGGARNVALVTHGGVIMALLTYVILGSANLPLNRSLGVFKILNASITALAYSKGRWRILYVNQTPV